MARALRPQVAAHFAVSWDGRISTRGGTPLESPGSKAETCAGADAILFTSETAAAETPAEVYGAGASRLLRVLASEAGRVDPKWKFFQGGASRVIVYSTLKMPQRTQAALAALPHVEVNCWETLDPARVLRHLRAAHAVRRLICEGGASLFRTLAQADLVDELYLTWHPRIFGGRAAPSITGPPGEFLPRGVELRLARMSVSESECFTEYRVRKAEH